MSAGKLHANEIETSIALVEGLIAQQFPQWADLPITQVRSAGTSNVLYRLGKEMVARLPRTRGSVIQLEKEQQWLPKLAPYLPLDVPALLAKGVPGEGYPCSWSIYRWLKGENATLERIADPERAAVDLADFLLALRQLDTTGGPRPGTQNFGRGAPLASRDVETRAAISAIDAIPSIALDTDDMLAAWDRALAAPEWKQPPVWIHGDLHAENLLAVDGRLSAVIDFGGLGIGDPACDVMAAWLYLPAQSRERFRAALAVDDATWIRGQGWALSMGVIALPYYHKTNPILSAIARRAIDAVLADQA